MIKAQTAGDPSRRFTTTRDQPTTVAFGRLATLRQRAYQFVSQLEQASGFSSAPAKLAKATRTSSAQVNPCVCLSSETACIGQPAMLASVRRTDSDRTYRARKLPRYQSLGRSR
jgi:hypothetical protein